MFTCGNVMGRRVVITTHEVMCDIRHRAKRKAADWRREGNNPRARGDDLVAGSQAADLVLRRRILYIVKVYSELL